jgi:hypothetical protein
MARKRRNTDDDYDNGRSYDDYDYGKLTSEDDTMAVDNSDDEQGAEFGRILIWNAVNNTALFVTAYMLMFVIYQVATSTIAYRRFLNSVIRYYITNVTPVHNNWLYNYKTIIWIYAAGPVACLLTGMVCYFLYFKYFQKNVSLMRNFLLWMFLIGAMMTFGNIASGILIKDTYRGVGYAIAWGRTSMTLRYIYIGASIVMMILVGFFTVKAFLQTATRSDLVRRRGGARLEFLFFNVLIPIGAGSVIVFFPRLPALEYYEILAVLFFIPTLLAMFSYGRQITTIRLVRTLDDIPISKSAIGIAVGVLVLCRVLLDPGIDVNAFDKELEKPLKEDNRKTEVNRKQP